MSEPTLFDQPSARTSDPLTSHLAAAAVTPGTNALEDAILILADRPDGRGETAFAIAERVEWQCPGRWDESTIRTRVSALGKQGKLVKCAEKGISPRGRVADRWRLP